MEIWVATKKCNSSRDMVPHLLAESGAELADMLEKSTIIKDGDIVRLEHFTVSDSLARSLMKISQE